MGNKAIQFARNGGTLFYHDQLLLTSLMAIQRQCGGELFNQDIHQLLLIMAKMTPLRQGRQQNIVLYTSASWPSLQGYAAIANGQYTVRAGLAAFITTGHIWLAGKLLVVLFITSTIYPQFDIAWQGQTL